MKVLVIGSGGREHALVWKLRQSPRVTKLYCAPGNAGIERIAACVAISATDIKGLADFAEREGIELTVVGPESSLVLGVVDAFTRRGLRIFGPSRRAAVLEGSKVFTKKFMKKHNIPAAAFEVFSKPGPAIKYIEKIGAPVVVKADGLAAGKGVIVARSVAEAKKAVALVMQDKAFGKAGNKVVVEEFMTGEEASFLAFTDGRTVLPLPTSQDHKAVYDNDRGPNTGGMGAYSPAPVVTEEIHRQVMKRIMLPTVRAMAKAGRPYKGVLYAGLMISNGEARVVEFNCRFGDPEAQPLLMRLKTDLLEVIEAVLDGKLSKISLDIDARPTVCVVMSSAGYPGSYQKGMAISGLDQADAQDLVEIFHAGTAVKDGRIVTAGGRVLGVSALGDNLQEAIKRAYAAVGLIKWQGVYFRKDIGQKALPRLPELKTGIEVGIVMGSDSDLKIMQEAVDFLKTMGISHEITVASAHRTPARATAYAESAAGRGLKIIIAGAGMAAHLAGVLAANTILPVIGVPIDVPPLNGFDALLSTVQMPPGVPVATMGIGKSGARNAAVLAARILALENQRIAEKLAGHKQEMAARVERAAEKINNAL